MHPAAALQQGGTHFLLSDHLGITQMELSATGQVLWTGDFAPIGQELDTNSTTNRYKFTGKERDAKSGLDDFGATYYSSVVVGRFTSSNYSDEDDGPVSVPSFNPKNPQSLNLYSYVRNNTLSFTDLDGHDVNVCVIDGNGGSTAL